MIAANMKPLYEKEAAQRKMMNSPFVQKDSKCTTEPVEVMGRTSEIVGKMFGVSGQTVKRASAVIKNGVEELQEAVKAGEVSVRAAHDLSKLTPEGYKSTFQWVGGLPKVYLFCIYMEGIISDLFIISFRGL